MATWEELKGYIASNYRIEQDIGKGVKLTFDVGGGRSQEVFVTHYVLKDGTEDWVVIDSPIGEVGRVDYGRALAAAGDLVCGGLAFFMGETITLRHAIPLANLDINEFERPFLLVTKSADDLEAQLTGRDEF